MWLIMVRKKDRSLIIGILVIAIVVVTWNIAKPETPTLDHACKPNGITNNVLAFIRGEDFWNEEWRSMADAQYDYEEWIRYANDGMYLAYATRYEAVGGGLRFLDLNKQQALSRIQNNREAIRWLEKCLTITHRNFSGSVVR
jgi:hypothetical protein